MSIKDTINDLEAKRTEALEALQTEAIEFGKAQDDERQKFSTLQDKAAEAKIAELEKRNVETNKDFDDKVQEALDAFDKELEAAAAGDTYVEDVKNLTAREVAAKYPKERSVQEAEKMGLSANGSEAAIINRVKKALG